MRVAISIARIEPVIPLTAENVALEIIEIIDRWRAGEPIRMGLPIAPVGQGPVDINGDGVVNVLDLLLLLADWW